MYEARQFVDVYTLSLWKIDSNVAVALELLSQYIQWYEADYARQIGGS
jgi:hypothetical protein